jgi:putative flippase GtrA
MAEKIPSKIIKNQVVRFILSAGAGFVVDISAFYIFYHNLLTKKSYVIFNITLRNFNISLAISFFLGVMVNFLITRYLVFSESKLAPYKQFARFCAVAFVGFFSNLGVIQILIRNFNMYPPVARIATALSLFFASYFVHKIFSFSLSLRHHAVRSHHK